MPSDPKQPRVIRQLLDRKPDDIQLVQLPPGQPPRLQLAGYAGRFDPAHIAAEIRRQPDAIYFLDSTQFLAKTDDRIWDALLSDRRIAMPPPVFAELQWWLNDEPRHNAAVHRLIKASRDGDDNAPIRWVSPETPEGIAIHEYYVNLLGMRKQMMDVAREKLEAQLGRKATNQEVSNYCQQVGTSRAQLLGRQGQHAKVPEHIYNDEQLVVLAILAALKSGRDVTIISSDEAVLDQFYKAVFLTPGLFKTAFDAATIANEQYQAGLTTGREVRSNGGQVTIGQNDVWGAHHGNT